MVIFGHLQEHNITSRCPRVCRNAGSSCHHHRRKLEGHVTLAWALLHAACVPYTQAQDFSSDPPPDTPPFSIFAHATSTPALSRASRFPRPYHNSHVTTDWYNVLPHKARPSDQSLPSPFGVSPRRHRVVSPALAGGVRGASKGSAKSPERNMRASEALWEDGQP